jgi:hypothetical protein
MHINFSLRRRLASLQRAQNGKLIRPEAELTHHFSAFAPPRAAASQGKSEKSPSKS